MISHFANNVKSVLVRFENGIQHNACALCAVLDARKFGFAVGKTVLALNENHRCGEHIRGKLRVVTCARVNVLMLYAKLLAGLLYIADKLFVPVNGISVPSLYNLAGAAAPGLFRAALYDIEHLFEHLGIFVT